MLDLQTAQSLPPKFVKKTTMSRKRTRSVAEEDHMTRIQPLNMSFCNPPPFSDDQVAQRTRDECDYSIKITREMAESGNTPRPVRVYADGAFDLFHQGHARILMQAKNVFPNVYLIVGVCSDEMLHKMKGRTVMDEDERYNSVRHCRYTDEVIKDAPWVPTKKFMDQHKIDFIAHDDIPYASGNIDDVYAEVKARGMFVATQRTEGISTSDLVARIVRNYDEYIRRNLNRGYSAKELNVPYYMEKKIRIQNKMQQLKDKSKAMKDDLLTKWEERSKDLIDNFLLMFSKRNLRTIWDGGKQKILRAITPPVSRSSSPSRNGHGISDLSHRIASRKSRRLR